MQSLQKVVLNKLQPGKVPIFIVSPNMHDGDAMSALLSAHLKAPDRGGEAPVAGINYFHSVAAQRLVARMSLNDYKCTADDSSSLEFILNKDFQNGSIWGVQLNYEAFLSLKVLEKIPQCFCIFIYGNAVNEISTAHTEASILEKIYRLQMYNTTNCVLVHQNDVLYSDSLVLTSLNIDLSSYRVFPNAGKSAAKPDGRAISRVVPDEAASVYRLLNKDNLLIKQNGWFLGEDLLVLLMAPTAEAALLAPGKIALYSQSFVYPPHIQVIVANEQIAHSISEEGLVRSLGDSHISIVVAANGFSECANKAVAESGSRYILVDDLTLAFSPSALLHGFVQGEEPVFCTANILAEKLINLRSDRLSLVDVLTTRSFLGTAAFSAETWKKNGGLDSQLNNQISVWDLCIKALKGEPSSFCCEAPAQSLLSTSKSDRDKVLDDANFATIVARHNDVYEQHMGSVLYVASRNQVVAQNEIVSQHLKNGRLVTELDKAKVDNVTITEHNQRLRNHIDFIEQNRMYRISKKLKHYKQIFFKDGKAGGGGFKKFLKFILFSFSRAGLLILRKVFKRILRQIYLWVEDRPVKLIFLDKSDGDRSLSYQEWIGTKLNIKLLKADFEEGKATLVRKPKISILVPVYNPPLSFLHDAIKSVINQLYDNWELCIADDCSPNPQIKRLLNAYAMKDPRIKVKFRETNGHISAASNSALELATGEYVLLLDHDDLLTPNCLFEVVKHINEHPEDKLIYSDEDKVDSMGVHSSPFFKPDWSPDKFLAINYISHVVVIERKLVEQVGGFRLGFEGSQDYDLLLRVSEATQHIGHIPKVLYNWRVHSLSVASEEGDAKPYAYIAAKKALEEALVRRGTPGEVQFQSIRGSYRIKYHISSYGKVSILIPTKDAVQMLKNTIDSIFSLTAYPNYEVVVLNNNSRTPEFFELMDEYVKQHGDRFKCVEASFPFNFSKLMNLGVANSDGEYVLLLNNDVEILQKDWINTMVSYAQHEKNGAIGVKLLYPDDTIQHAGTVIGLGDIRCAGHVFVGFYKDSPGYYNYLQSVDNNAAVTAACLMVRRNVYEEVGGMEEALEVEYNDVDFCLRILDKGYFNLYVPDVVLYHYESATRGHPQQTKESYERHVREVAFFQQKWKKYIERDPYYNPNLSLDEGDYRMNLSLTERELSYK